MQTCIGHVLDCIEARARHGFRCTIDNERMLFFPRVGAIGIDTPERVKYFGLRSVRSCGICRLRKGRSVMRVATRHDGGVIRTLYDRATANVRTRPLQRRRKRARETLKRHGLDYKKRCRLMEHASCSLVRIDKFGETLFAGLVRYERMHIYFIGYCNYLMELLIPCVSKAHYAQVLKVVKACHQFWDPVTGATHPRLPYLLKMTHLTAERRVRAIFYWAHVLGRTADVIVQPCRLDAKCAVATLQLILIATRGHRAYTSHELDVIFTDVGRQFFTHLENIAQYFHDVRLARERDDHARDPDNHANPEAWQKETRYLYVLYLHLYAPFNINM